MSRPPVHIAALLTCHNRKAETMACLQALHAQDLPEAASLQVILVDDGSTDGTAEAVAEAYPDATILHGDGSLFWNGGMRMAFAEALRAGFDFYLWLNDDTQLIPGALSGLLKTYRRVGDEKAILIGSTHNAQTGVHTYGGLVRRSRWHPFKYRLVPPGPRPIPCEVMNGNCVLIPRAAARVTGNLDARFTHAIGDFDYALRARRAGCSLWVAPGYAGTCSRNAVQGSWEDKTLPFRRRWKKICGPKGLPPREWMLYARRHAGALWPFYSSLPYLRVLLSALVKR